ncbi:MAG: hypothetical protein AAF366_01930 [Pseudomonadota bacterium]
MQVFSGYGESGRIRKILSLRRYAKSRGALGLWREDPADGVRELRLDVDAATVDARTDAASFDVPATELHPQGGHPEDPLPPAASPFAHPVFEITPGFGPGRAQTIAGGPRAMPPRRPEG